MPTTFPRICFVLSILLLANADSTRAWAEEAVIDGAPAADKRKLPDGTVRFEPASSRITTESAQQLDRIAEFLKGQPDGDVLVVGHTDRHGSPQVNLNLSRKRARTVKTELAARQIAPERIQVIGVGSSEPLSSEQSERADALNRRVEVWVGTREAIAYVSWIYRTVQAQKPAVTKWDAAYVQMELRRLFRVRTLGQSAGEVTFTEGHRLFLGPEAFMVVYGRDARKRRNKKRVADVTLEEGTLLASLASRGRRELTVKTDAARMGLVRTKKTRISSSKAKARSTVSVYDGRADVAAQGEEVRVDGGYGTRVKNGQAPEPPSPLPPAPEWTSLTPATVFSGVFAPALRWKTKTSTTKAIIELGDYGDLEIKRPTRTWAVTDEYAPALDIEPGRYWVRVTSVSKRDVVGFPSPARELRVLPQPEPIEGPRFEQNGTELIMTYPGIVRLGAPAGHQTEWQLDGGVAEREAYLGPGEHTLSCTSTDKNGRVSSAHLPIRVEQLRLAVKEIAQPVVDGIDSVSPVTVEITDYRGRPIEGLDLVTATPDPLRREVSVEASGPGPMEPIDAPLTATAKGKDRKEGQYRLRHRDFAPPTDESTVLVVYERGSRTGRTLEVPMAGLNRTRSDPAPARPRLKAGMYVGAGGGFMRGAGGDFGPGVRGEAGLSLTQGLLRLTLGLDGGFTSLSTSNDVGRLSLYPINAKITFGLRLDPVRPYIGLAGGLRLQSLSRETGVATTVEADDVSENLVGIAGLGVHLKGFEPYAELRYGKMTVPGVGIDQVANGPSLYLGVRFFFTDG